MISDAVYENALAERDAARERIAELTQALRGCRELFVELRGDWSDNRGPCREGFAIIDGVLGEPLKEEQ